MSEPATPSPAPEVVDLPLPFEPNELEKFKGQVAPVTSPPTSYSDCQKLGGHGGPKGKRLYFPSGPVFGKLLGESQICEICGMTGLKPRA